MKFFRFIVIKIIKIYRNLYNYLRFFGKEVNIGKNTWISPRAIIKLNQGGKITIGENVEIHPFAVLMTYGGEISIGNNSSINPFSIVYGHGNCTIGNGVRIAAHVTLIPSNHIVNSKQPIYKSGVSSKGIVIEDNVWIGTGAKILDGIKVSSNVVIGAGSVVTASIEEGVICAGVPAKVIRRVGNV